MIEIRRFRLDEAPQLISFIHEHWQANHVLARRPDLLAWQHGQADGYAYFGAWEGDELLAVLGYIPVRRYDPVLASDADNVLWLALWKLREDVKVAGLGMRLLAAVGRSEPHAAIGVLGINPDHLPMYTALGYRTGALSHHAVFRSNATPALASWPGAPPRLRDGRARLEPMELGAAAAIDRALQLGERQDKLPRKSAAYFENRYLRHPYYRYQVHTVSLDGVQKGLLATRITQAPLGRALRIVDWYGDERAFAEIGRGLAHLLEKADAEYADIWEEGLGAEALEQAGFARVERAGPMVVPNLFEPFVPANRPILFAIKGEGTASVVLMKADGDQDRPNLLAVDE